MHSRLLEDALTAFAEEVSISLQEELAAGAEIPFELESTAARRRRGASLYSYKPLTDRFLRERWPDLTRLRGCAEAVSALDAFHGLERYLSAHGAGPARRSQHPRARASEALRAFVEDVFRDQSDFRLQDERLELALTRLDAAAATDSASVTIVATLHGVAISSPEVTIAEGFAIARPEALSGLPEEALWSDPFPSSSASGGTPAERLIVTLRVSEAEAGSRGDQAGLDEGSGLDQGFARAMREGQMRLRDLLRALRLFGDGRIALGPLAWACGGEGPFRPIPLSLGGRPHGMLLVQPDQEDELRAFCSLLKRRSPATFPATEPLGWALRRWEIGCERASEHEALTDHLLALQALLDPERASEGLLAGRLAALCAPPEARRQMAERMLKAIALERAVASGQAAGRSPGLGLCREVASHLGALLRDVICGHLDRDLAALADELLLSGARSAEERKGASTRPAGRASAEQMRSDLRERVDVLDVLVEVGDQQRLRIPDGA